MLKQISAFGIRRFSQVFQCGVPPFLVLAGAQLNEQPEVA